MEVNDMLLNYRARKTVCEMLHDRGFQLSAYLNFKTLKDVHSQTQQQFSQQYQKDPFSWQIMATKGDTLLYVHCTRDFQAAMELQLLEIIRAKEIGVLVLVTKTQARRKQLDQFVTKARSEKCTIQPFLLEQLQFNITKNFMVPKHQVMSEQAKEDMLRRFRITEEKLPIISKTDPVARYLGLCPGQVVMISRRTADDNYVNFRLCK